MLEKRLPYALIKFNHKNVSQLMTSSAQSYAGDEGFIRAPERRLFQVPALRDASGRLRPRLCRRGDRRRFNI
ncbi:hypothetical protein SRHO_G00055750 [Serrasalmus rhombeus]